MHVGVEALRSRIQHTMEENMDKVDEDIATLFKDWIANRQFSVRTREIRDILVPKLEALNTDFAKEILDLKQYLIKKSQWIIGGDEPLSRAKRQHQHHPPATNRGQHRQPRRPRAPALPPARQQPLRRGTSLPPPPR